MELLLAVIREDQATLLDGPAAAAGPGDRPGARPWPRCGGTCPAVLGEPSPVRKIMIQELAAHPEIRQRALELHEQMAAWSRDLAQASEAASRVRTGRAGKPGDAPARA